MKLTDLKGMNLADLGEFVKQLGVESYRAQQIFSWIYAQGVNRFDEMTNLSKDLRAKLVNLAVVEQLRLGRKQESANGDSWKFLFQLTDGLTIESVLMVEGTRRTLCVSTQVGCAIDCKFCATGMMGLTRNLSAGEIVDQLLSVQQLSGEKVTNVVFMGMGEPLHNYVNVIKAAELMSHASGPNLAKKHIVISTSGLVSKITQFANEGHKFKLAISLNATEDSARNEIMPLNKKWPLKQLIEAARYYTKKSGEAVTFEYVLLAGINDSMADAERLRRLIEGVFCKINLIPYNATQGKFRRPSRPKIEAFYQRLANAKAPVTIRWSKGEDIDAACGQLATVNAIENA